MRIKEITFEVGHDFHAIMVCEHCGREQNNRAGYHDSFYHTQVVPGMFCKCCGKNREGVLGDRLERKPTADEAQSSNRAD